MGYITIACLGLTILALVSSALLGLKRGLNRSILRLVLVVISIALAIALRKTIADLIMSIKIDGQTLEAYLLSYFTSGEVAIPESLQNVIFALIEILLGIVAYILLFYILRFLTWVILYPICKIFVRSGAKKRSWWGALVGLAQGFIVAFCLLAPVTGLVVQVDEVSKLKIEGEPLFVLKEEIGVSDYHESALGKTYIAIGDWYFDLLSSTTMEDGTKVSVHDTVDIVSTAIGFIESAHKISDDATLLDDPSATEHQIAESLSQMGDHLIEMGNNLNALSEDAKKIIDTIIDDAIELIPTDELPESVVTILDSFTTEGVDFVGVGESVKGIANFVDKVEIENTPEAVTQEDVNNIVHGLSLNPAVTESLATLGGGLLDVAEMGFEDEFMAAINSVEDAKTKEDLMKLFGLDTALIP